jgi:hypothetical protein
LTSHGPTRGLYTPAEPFRTLQRPEATGAPAANPPMSAERMRAAVSPAAGQRALLQPGVLRGSRKVEALEGPAEIPGDGDWQRETQRAEPAVPRTRPQPETNHTGGGTSGGGEGNHSELFSTTVATVPAAIRGSPNSGDRQPKGSVPARADRPWNALGSASDAGAVPSSSSGTSEHHDGR